MALPSVTIDKHALRTPAGFEAFEARHRFRGRTDDEAAAWLFGIARHVLSRYVRRGRAERQAPSANATRRRGALARTG
jgi:DNA-directed RNA polymerase specialized sigma24 family protein